MSAAADRIPAGVIDEAIAWVVRLEFNTPTAETAASFRQWLLADACHELAWERVQTAKTAAGALPADLVVKTLDAVEDKRRRQLAARRQALKLLGLGGVGLGMAWSAREFTPWQRLLADSATRVGEQRELTLEDGTQVLLNTDTAIGTEFDPARRLLNLYRGEILVTTGADANALVKRPFWIQTPPGRLQALGTRFVVRLEEEGARIAVQEGAVELHPADGTASAVAAPGECWFLTARGAQSAATPRFAPDAWAEGVISGSDIPLGELLAELGRYRPGHLGWDPAVADLRVSGIYQIHDTDQALAFLSETQPIRVRYHSRYWVSVDPA